MPSPFFPPSRDRSSAFRFLVGVARSCLAATCALILTGICLALLALAGEGGAGIVGVVIFAAWFVLTLHWFRERV